MSDEFVETVPCPTWDDLVRELDRLASSSWIFRGQIDCDWSLQTSLERLAPDGLARGISEHILIDEFKRRAHNYLDAHQIPAQGGEWIALMQHYGAPTRLLDFTRSPFVGAYFAFESLPASTSDECVVWAIDTDWCLDTAGAFELLHDDGLRADILGRVGAIAIPNHEALRPESITLDSVSVNRAAGQHLAASVAQGVLGSVRPVVVPFEPQKLSVRLSVQQGLFLVPLNPEMSFMEILHAQVHHRPGGVKKVKKFVTPHSERPRALEQLRHMNVTRASLFPGLQGFAESLQHYLIRESPQRRRERLP